MALETLSIRKLEKKTTDQFEAVVVMSQRAKQILQDRVVQKMLEAVDETEMGLFDELPKSDPEDYVEQEKITTKAVGEFMEGKLNWEKSPPEEV
ncbi:MAG: hypothetical protein V3S22_05760 [Candidatus Neomarinimicrobiota bacterium]